MGSRRRNRVADNADVVEFRGVVFIISVRTYTPPTVSPLPGLHIVVTEPISGEVVYRERIRFADVNLRAVFDALKGVEELFITEHSSVVRSYQRYLSDVLNSIVEHSEYLNSIPDHWSDDAEWLAVQKAKEAQKAEQA